MVFSSPGLSRLIASVSWILAFSGMGLVFEAGYGVWGFVGWLRRAFTSSIHWRRLRLFLEIEQMRVWKRQFKGSRGPRGECVLSP